MKYEDIANLNERELAKRARELRGQMFEARMKNSLGQLTNPMMIRELRRDFARLQTALTAKTMSGSGSHGTKAGTKG